MSHPHCPSPTRAHDRRSSSVFPFRARFPRNFQKIKISTLSDRARVVVSRTPFSRLALISRSTTSRVLSAFALARRRRHDRLFGVVGVGVVTTASPRAQSSRLGAHALASRSRRRARSRIARPRPRSRRRVARALSRARVTSTASSAKWSANGPLEAFGARDSRRGMNA